MLGLISLFFVTMPLPARRHLALARKRRALGEGEFVTMMAFEGVSGTTARFLWNELSNFYHSPLAPFPDDRLETVIVIDRPEIEGIVGRFWSAMRGNDARPLTGSMAPDPTVVELGRHCDLLAGWSVRGSA
ncbi:MAG: hypothetical protein M3Q88_04820 [Pseudomonadota bacterium]|nr:hypothetical protein [Pseudomonadota bacterium]